MLSDTQLENYELGRNFSKVLFNEIDNNHTNFLQQFKKLWKRSADFGLTALPIPKSFNGLETDLTTIVSLMEGIGSQCDDVGFMFSLNAHLWAGSMPIVTFGTQSQKQCWLPSMAAGETIACFAVTESDCGSDVFSSKTHYESTENGFKLDGSKTFITNAPVADIFLVLARKAGTEGVRGLSYFIVQRNNPGLKVGKSIEKMGLQRSPMSSVYLNNCIVPKDALLGNIENNGAIVFNTTMNCERPFLLAFQVGVMQHQLNRCVEYARSRKQSGKPIISYQAISNRLADMKVRIEAAKLLVYQTAQNKTFANVHATSSSVAKLFVSESFVENSLSAMRTYGGYGYTKEYLVEQQLRDSVAGLFYSGTSDIQRNIIASTL